jgi:dienelactone hydrolase
MMETYTSDMRKLPRSWISQEMQDCVCGTLLNCFAVALFLVLATTMPARSGEFIEQHQYLRVKIGAQTVRLDALIVKRADAKGRLPVALINHGRPTTEYEALETNLDDSSGLFARELARRGWLAIAVARRGFGLSDGPEQVDANAPCREGLSKSWMNADADDIQAALEVIVKRPDVDAARVVAFGFSAGGGASIALGARNLPDLLAVVSIAGGSAAAGCSSAAFIAADYKELGSGSHVPNLWVYARNDPKIPPADAELMRAAFSAAGGDVKFVMLDPLGDDGHAMMATTSGYLKWLPEMDSFLQAHGLPTWQPSEVDFLLHRLGLKGANQRSYIEQYMSAPGEKALAWSTTSGASTFSMKPTIDAAKNAALQGCETTAPRCAIVMENDRWVGGDR